MKTLKIIGQACYFILTFIAVLVIIGYVYYHYFVKDITLGVNYMDNQVGIDIEEMIKADELSEEEKKKYEDRYFLEVNYYSNDAENGLELQELQLNYFTDYTLESSAYRSTGMQYVGDYKGYSYAPYQITNGTLLPVFIDKYYGLDAVSVDNANKYVDKSFTYYDSSNGITFGGSTNENGSIQTELKRENLFCVKIDGKPYGIQLDKYIDKHATNFMFFGFKTANGYNRYYYHYGSLFQTCMQAVRTNSAGYGDYYITVDLSSLFTIKEYDAETGKFKADDVTDIIKTYSVLKFHYDENGAYRASQSMFGAIEGERNYGMTNTEYWQERVNYTLTENSQYMNENVFEYRYSEVYGGYFVSLTMDAKNLFKDMPRTDVFIELNLDSPYLLSDGINVVGIDYNGFENCKINTITIKGSPRELYVLNKGLVNTELKALKHSDGIILNYSSGAFNNEFDEVII